MNRLRTTLAAALMLAVVPSLATSASAGAHANARRANVARPTIVIPPIPIVGDFNGDGRSDVVSYTAGVGADRLWYSSGNSLVAGPAINVNGTYTPIVGDYNGDGRDDIFWSDRAHSTNSSVWYGTNSGAGFARGPLLRAPMSTSDDIYVPTAGDFNGDGKTDIVWADLGHGQNGRTTGSPLWYSVGIGFSVAAHNLPTVPCTTRVGCWAASGDFNGDGRADLFFYRARGYADKVWWSNGPGFVGGHASVNGVYRMMVGDFNGDGNDDIIWYAPGIADDSIWFGQHGNGFLRGTLDPINGDYTPVIGDFNGDAHSDVVFYAPGPATDYLRYGIARPFLQGPAIAINGRYDPAVGDFNGDGKDDIVWFAQNGDPSYVWYGEHPGFLAGSPRQL